MLRNSVPVEIDLIRRKESDPPGFKEILIGIEIVSSIDTSFI
jgi:hypothetical protein